MRLIEGVGVEWGINWVISHLIEMNLPPVDLDEMFEAHISGCYPETVSVGWMEFDTITTMKNSDPISWDIAKDEWINAEVEEGLAFTIDNGCVYYWVHDLESFLEDKLNQKEVG
jgi:hypothetical protein